MFFGEKKILFKAVEKDLKTVRDCCRNATIGWMLHFCNTKSATKREHKTFIEEKRGEMVRNITGMEIAYYRVRISEDKDRRQQIWLRR